MTSYNLQDYVFDLPPDRIAQHPAPVRDESRLMLLCAEQAPAHHRFKDLKTLLQPGDTLVLNQTKVMNARCFAMKENGVRIEIFILSLQVDPARVPVMFRPAKRVKPGTLLNFPKSGVQAEVAQKGEAGKGSLCFANEQDLHRVTEQDGQLPLPPYIKREQGPDDQDTHRYQTVFAAEAGAVAAPTAGLHFTDELLHDLGELGVEIHYVTHHVGIGTFKPVIAEDVRNHQMEAENYHLDESTAAALNRARQQGRRLIAVGTTSTRCLEANYNDGFHPGRYATNHYIYPGYRFRAIDGLITNFHLPGSSLMLLVSALMGRDRILNAYQEAIDRGYHFYSYGDAMLLLP